MNLLKNEKKHKLSLKKDKLQEMWNEIDLLYTL